MTDTAEENPSYEKKMWSTNFMIRTLDIGLATVFLILLAVPMVVISMFIILDDGSPILFRQRRVGKFCKPFWILKFRTMRNDASRATGDVTSAKDLAAARASFQTASAADARITKLGKILRSTHLDELPQFLNVLRGDMSLVGVRPDVPVQEADYEPTFWQRRHTHRPGVTGLAQLDKQADLFFQERCLLDGKWVQERNVKLYIEVLVRTVAKVFKRSGV